MAISPIICELGAAYRLTLENAWAATSAWEVGCVHQANSTVANGAANLCSLGCA